MKKIIFILLAISLAVACTKDDDDKGKLKDENAAVQDEKGVVKDESGKILKKYFIKKGMVTYKTRSKSTSDDPLLGINTTDTEEGSIIRIFDKYGMDELETHVKTLTQTGFTMGQSVNDKEDKIYDYLFKDLTLYFQDYIGEIQTKMNLSKTKNVYLLTEAERKKQQKEVLAKANYKYSNEDFMGYKCDVWKSETDDGGYFKFWYYKGIMLKMESKNIVDQIGSLKMVTEYDITEASDIQFNVEIDRGKFKLASGFKVIENPMGDLMSSLGGGAGIGGISSLIGKGGGTGTLPDGGSNANMFEGIKLFNVESGKITYKTTNNYSDGSVKVEGSTTTARNFKNWGLLDIEEETGTIKEDGTDVQVHNMSKLENMTKYVVDFTDKVIHKSNELLVMSVASTSDKENAYKKVKEFYIKYKQGKVVGTEKVLGYDCEIIEYSDGGGFDKDAKIWLHKGLVLKSEKDYSKLKGKGKSVKVATKIEFNVKVDDAVFKLPDYKITN